MLPKGLRDNGALKMIERLAEAIRRAGEVNHPERIDHLVAQLLAEQRQVGPATRSQARTTSGWVCDERFALMATEVAGTIGTTRAIGELEVSNVVAVPEAHRESGPGRRSSWATKSSPD